MLRLIRSAAYIVACAAICGFFGAFWLVIGVIVGVMFAVGDSAVAAPGLSPEEAVRSAIEGQRAWRNHPDDPGV